MIEIIEKKSKFVVYSFLIKTEEDVCLQLNLLKKEHKKATHICYAYNLFGKYKCSDDGEPSGTAGNPILNVILKNNLTNCLIVVVRYFGGIKLGAGGLTRMYGECARQILLAQPINNLVLYKQISFNINFNDKKYIDTLSQLKEVVEIEYEYGETITVNIVLQENNLEKVKDIINQRLNKDCEFTISDVFK